MRRGSLADAMRATMSLPLIFPPTEVDGQVLIDGGTMNNVPADIVKAMGASRVIAVNVGDLADRTGVASTMLGVAGGTLDAMMRASTRRALASADVVVNVPVAEYGSLDWRRAPALIEEGYRAAEAMRDQLLPLAVSEAEFDAWRRARQARRLKTLPPAAFIELDGFGTNDTKRLNVLLARHVGVPLDIVALEADLALVTGLDRYETVTWRMMRDGARGFGLRVRGRAKTYAPPFLMLGINLENTTSSDFRTTITGRYLAFDIVGSGSELRVDATIGSDPSLAMELYRPLGRTALFVAPYAGVGNSTFNLIEDDSVIARYRQSLSRVGINGGVNLGARSDVRVGVFTGRASASIKIGDPAFPEVEGSESGTEIVWRLDTQDRPVVPTGGLLSQVRLSRILNGPDIAVRGRNLPLRREADAAVGGGDSILELRSTQPCVRLRRRRHVVRRRSVADLSVRTGHAVQARRVQCGRAQRASLLHRDRWLSAADRPAARLHGRTDLRGRLARERGRLRRVVARRLADERRRRPHHGHAGRAGRDRRVLGL